MRMAWMVTAETRVMKLTRIDPHAPQAPSAHHRGTAAPTMLQCCCYSLFSSPGRTNATLKNATTFTITSNAARSTSQLPRLLIPHHSRPSIVDNPFNISNTGLHCWSKGSFSHNFTEGRAATVPDSQESRRGHVLIARNVTVEQHDRLFDCESRSLQMESDGNLCIRKVPEHCHGRLHDEFNYMSGVWMNNNSIRLSDNPHLTLQMRWRVPTVTLKPNRVL